jgi:hypothetical protein
MLLSLLIAGPQLSETPMYPTELHYLHQSPIEDVVRVLIDVIEIDPHRFQQIFADGLAKLPAPLGVEMGIGDYVQGGNLGNIWGLHGLPVDCGKQPGNSYQGQQQACQGSSAGWILRCRYISFDWI